MASEMVERVAHQIALEICEANWKQRAEWRWPDDFTGDTEDRARSCARAVLAVIHPTDAMTAAALAAVDDHNPNNEQMSASDFEAAFEAAMQEALRNG